MYLFSLTYYGLKNVKRKTMVAVCMEAYTLNSIVVLSGSPSLLVARCLLQHYY